MVRPMRAAPLLGASTGPECHRDRKAAGVRGDVGHATTASRWRRSNVPQHPPGEKPGDRPLYGRADHRGSPADCGSSG
jgi:hypothetical protein